MMGGTISRAQGGSFRDGALAAGIGAAAGAAGRFVGKIINDARLPAAEVIDTRIASNECAGDKTCGVTTPNSESENSESSFKPKASWITRVKVFFGLPGGRIGNTIARVGGTLANTGIEALDTDVALGLGSRSVEANLNLCESAGNCWVPEDRHSVGTYLSQDPPNWKALGGLFVKRDWGYRPYYKMFGHNLDGKSN